MVQPLRVGELRPAQLELRIEPALDGQAEAVE